MRELVTSLLFAFAINAIAFAVAVSLSESGIGEKATNMFIAGSASALLFRSLESRGWF